MVTIQQRQREEKDFKEVLNKEDTAEQSAGWSSAGCSSSVSVFVLEQHEDSDWKELPQWVRESAEVLGYTRKLWDRDKEPKVCNRDWKDLTDAQKEAAERLGYTTSALWDDDNDSSSSSSDESKAAKKGRSKSQPLPRAEAVLRLGDVHRHHDWTIYCIQLYTETEDYRFRIEEGMGLSMYANRPFEADEPIVRSPVGPGLHKGLFEFEASQHHENLNTKTGVVASLSGERKRFAERFLKWQHTDGTKLRVGAQNAQLAIRLEDFSNPSTTSKENRRLPRTELPTYDLDIFEHEIVLVEFVPSPSHTKKDFPPQRRFEILHYDEGLPGQSGEEGYDPHTAKRPPTLCGMEERSLEVPGHFSNHACGATSTAYDYVYPVSSDSGKQQKQQPQPSTETTLPDYIRNEIAARERVSENTPSDVMTTRRAIEPGAEITTDYSRWNWSTDDWEYRGESCRTPIGFFLGNNTTANRSKRWAWNDLSPRIQRMATILGYTEQIWESKQEISSTSCAGPPSAVRKAWKKLSLQEREAANMLTGHTEESWERWSVIKNDDDSNNDDNGNGSFSLRDIDWAGLSEEERKAAASIGHTEKTWNDKGLLSESIIGDVDCYYAFRPEVRDAMVVLGETEATWEMEDSDDDDDSDDEPWFECLCGDANCHSSKERGGFRGVKYFPFEEQRQIAPLCEPWVQQQFQWKLYQLEQQNQTVDRDT